VYGEFIGKRHDSQEAAGFWVGWTRNFSFAGALRFDKVENVSLEQLETAILGLTPEERQRLAVWFEENRRELLGDEPDELSEDQKAEVVRRRDLALAQPELLEPWDGTVERVRERLHEFRRQKASAR
jgi:hypothetical protein